jgi:hypothetical protein
MGPIRVLIVDDHPLICRGATCQTRVRFVFPPPDPPLAVTVRWPMQSWTTTIV